MVGFNPNVTLILHVYMIDVYHSLRYLMNYTWVYIIIIAQLSLIISISGW